MRKMKKIVVPLPVDLKRKLDRVRDLGFTLNGFTRRALIEALKKLPTRAA